MYDGCVLCMGAALIYVFLLPCTDVGLMLKFLGPGLGGGLRADLCCICFLFFFLLLLCFVGF